MLTRRDRIISAGIIPLTLAPFAAGSLNPVADSIFCALLVIHSHIGFEYASPPCPFQTTEDGKLTNPRSCIIDYFPTKRIPKIRAAANWALRIATVTLGLALYSFETNDVGITEAVSRLWHA
jgi:succinate dehydrogenase (ubiquinone) membrane anchor subunit